MAGGLDVFPAKLTLGGCEEMRPSIRVVSTKQPVHPQISVDPLGALVEDVGATSLLTADSGRVRNLWITGTLGMVRQR
jgi:hypothetical protein